MSALEIGAQVRLNAPMLEAHGRTGIITQVHKDQDGLPVTAQVEISGSGEKRWLHRLSLQPLSPATPSTHPLEACE